MIDPQKLERAAHETVTAALLSHLAKRTNDATVTTAELVTSLKKPDGSAISRGEAVRALQALEAAGCGRYRAGRRGQKTRLEWTTSAIETARNALGTGNSPDGPPSPNAPAAGTTRDDDETYDFRFPLRRGYEICITLPSDLDADERQRLATAISALPVS
jgi:hypothetical protein